MWAQINTFLYKPLVSVTSSGRNLEQRLTMVTNKTSPFCSRLSSRKVIWVLLLCLSQHFISQWLTWVRPGRWQPTCCPDVRSCELTVSLPAVLTWDQWCRHLMWSKQLWPHDRKLERELLLLVTRDHWACQCQVISTSKTTSIIAGFCDLCTFTSSYIYKTLVKAWLGSMASKLVEQTLTKLWVFCLEYDFPDDNLVF